MRNSTVIVFGLAVAMAMPVAAESVSPLKFAKEHFRMPSEIAPTRVRSEKAHAPKSSELAKKMKAGATKTYGWSNGKWVLDDSYTYAYDKQGNVIVEDCRDADGYYSRTVNEYNENGKVVFTESKISGDGVNYENNRKTEFEYDSILTNVITRRSEWLWMANGWQLIGNNYKRIIERDEDGNIMNVVIAVLYEGDYDPTQRLKITYGADGKAWEIAEEVLDYNGKEFFWVEGTKITNIVWERTNGQIYDIDDIFLGNNRLKSGVYEDADGIVMDLTVEYANDNDGYTVAMEMSESGVTVLATTEYTPLDNDGYILQMKSSYMGTTIVTITEEIQNDDWGLMTLQSLKEESYMGEWAIESVIGEVVYDAEGKPEVYTVWQQYADDMGEEDPEYIIRAEYSDYVDVTAAVDAAIAVDGQEKYYNLQGFEVKEPVKGEILIRRQGKVKY